MTTDEVRVISDIGRAATLMDPDRMRLVASLRERPDSAAGLARRLGERRQRLNYHLRALEDAGVLEAVPTAETRRGRERIFRVSARQFVIDPATLGPLAAEPSGSADVLSADHLVALAARTIHEVAELRARSEAGEGRVATGSLDVTLTLASPGDFRTFLAQLTEAIAQVVARHHRPGRGGREFRLVTGLHQKTSRGAATSTETTEDQDDDST